MTSSKATTKFALFREVHGRTNEIPSAKDIKSAIGCIKCIELEKELKIRVVRGKVVNDNFSSIPSGDLNNFANLVVVRINEYFSAAQGDQVSATLFMLSNDVSDADSTFLQLKYDCFLTSFSVNESDIDKFHQNDWARNMFGSGSLLYKAENNLQFFTNHQHHTLKKTELAYLKSAVANAQKQDKQLEKIMKPYFDVNYTMLTNGWNL